MLRDVVVVVRSIEIDVFGVPGLISGFPGGCTGRRMGESDCDCGAECRLNAASDFLGEALRRGTELLESKLPCAMPCRQVMMRSLGGCVERLSLRERLVRDIMLLGRPMPEVLLMDAVSHCSVSRMRF